MSDTAHDSPCIFCKIACGALPSALVLETPEAIAFLDIHPLNPGHTLLVPRSHHAHLSELPDVIAAHAGSLLPRICRAVQAATGSEGLNVLVNHGRAAGQTIDHVHWHIIPRFTGDPIHWPWRPVRYAGEEMSQMQGQIKDRLRAEMNSDEHP